MWIGGIEFNAGPDAHFPQAGCLSSFSQGPRTERARIGSQAARRRMKTIGRATPLKNIERSFMQLNATDAQVAYDESLLAASVMFDRPGFGWTRLLHRLADGQSFEDAIGSFGFAYADLEAPFAR